MTKIQQKHILLVTAANEALAALVECADPVNVRLDESDIELQRLNTEQCCEAAVKALNNLELHIKLMAIEF